MTGERPVTGERISHQAGGFGRGSAINQELLRRYLLTRALGSSIRSALQWCGVVLLLLAVLGWVGGVKIFAVLIGLLAVGVLLVRALLSGVQRRFSGAARLGADEHQVSSLVGQTRRGLRHELRRVGLPGSALAPLLILVKLIDRRARSATLHKLASVDLLTVVPQSRVEELQVMLARVPR